MGKKIIHRFIVVMVLICTTMAVMPVGSIKIKADTTILYSGKSGDLDWSIDSEGLLSISGVGNYEKEYYDINARHNVPAWCEYCGYFNSVKVNVQGIDDTSDMFYGCRFSYKFDFSNFETENVTNMSSMFARCEYSEKIDVSHLNTENVTNMSSMFFDCESLEELDVSKFDTRNVTDMSSMFSGCKSLEELDVSKFDTGNVTDMSSMFWDCSGLRELDLSNFDTRNVTLMGLMFMDCFNLKSVNLSSFDTKNVRGMEFMFWSCSSLRELDLSNFDLGNVTNMSSMFADCLSLTVIKTPKNMNGYNDELPKGIWRDSEGKIYTEFPYSSSESIELRKDVIGESLPDETEDKTISDTQKPTEKETTLRYQQLVEKETKKNLTKISDGKTLENSKIKQIKKAKKSLKITWKKVENVNGYQIQYSTSGKFKKSKKITIKQAKTTSRIIKRLKARKKYYVRIRTYIIVNGKKKYSNWSKAKSKITK